MHPESDRLQSGSAQVGAPVAGDRAAARQTHEAGATGVEQSVEALVRRFEDESTSALLGFFTRCGVGLALLLVLFRLQPALSGDADAVRHIIEACIIFGLSMVNIVLVRRRMFRSSAVGVIALSAGMVLVNIFVWGLGPRAASAPFLCLGLMVAMWTFGPRIGRWFLMAFMATLFAAAILELLGLLPGAVALGGAVPIEINLACLTGLYLMTASLVNFQARRNRMLLDALARHRDQLQSTLAQTEVARNSKARFLSELSDEVREPLARLVQAIDELNRADQQPAQQGNVNSLPNRILDMLESALSAARESLKGKTPPGP